MALANQQWRPISVYEMVCEFLRSERHKFPGERLTYIDAPHLHDPLANHARLRMLYRIRAGLIGEVPPDTQWFNVEVLSENELGELLVIGRCGWDDDAKDSNELLKVAIRKPQKLTKPFQSWPKLILWGHDRTGPFTILEGNNRLTAYVSTACGSGLRIPVIVGLSPTPCAWHKPDPAMILCNDLWKSS